MNTKALKKDLERKTHDVFEKPGSIAIQAFYEAKRACADAGIPEEEIQGVVYSVTSGVTK